MAQTLILIRHARTLGTYSFTTGFTALLPPPPTTEEEILRHALYLERHGHPEEALAYLERRCPKK